MSPWCVAVPPSLAGSPSDTDQLGDAFVDAWLSFRQDMDTLSHGNIHPNILDGWLDNAPRFLLRDMVRLGTEPQLVLAAAKRLSKNADSTERHLLTELIVRYQDIPAGFEFVALGVIAADQTILDNVNRDFSSSNPEVQFNSAKVLVAAGDIRGLTYLRRQVSDCGAYTAKAAKMLGRYGTQADRKIIESAIAKGCTDDALGAASGEIEFRRLFPEYYSMMIRRDPNGMRYHVFSGLYDTWMTGTRRAVRDGARSISDFIRYVEGQSIDRKDWPSQDSEVIRRRMKEFSGFLRGVQMFLRTTDSKPTWPVSFDDALDNLKRRHAKKDNQSVVFEMRVSSAISLCTMGAKKLDHSRFELSNNLSVRSLTPDGHRVNDGNFATTWTGKRGDALQFVFGETIHLEEIWLTNSCSDNQTVKIPRVTLSVFDGSGVHSDNYSLKQHTRYYQRIPVPKGPVTALSIELSGLSDETPACIGELRIIKK